MNAPLETVRAWMDLGTAKVEDVVRRLSDADLDADTALPGWTRRHLLAHLGFNAEALRHLASWAATGVRNPMYASAEARNAEIEEGARWAPARLREFVVETDAALRADLDALPAHCWDAQVETAQGRIVAATEIPWMRTREVAVHAVDLAAGVGFADLPDELCLALIDDVMGRRASRGTDPAFEVSVAGQRWTVPGEGEPAQVTGSPAALAQWLTGRGAAGLTTPPDQVPALPRWL
ncbi:MAG TPA: maleylpyruvate isomerase family mycothiol-dependent enzyme [Actinomycetes bacterium]|nr:maleylpyruvate isomerase family mycothiol-dependent enzyme [Actinomycetes bacterium]